MNRAILTWQICVLVGGWSFATAADPSTRFVSIDPTGKLHYPTDSRGNRIPDFSHAGYGGGQPIPTATGRVCVRPRLGDNTARIQAACDEVAKSSPDRSGLCGAVILKAGRYDIAGQIHVPAGVVLRGEGATLVAIGQDRRAVIRIAGSNERVAGPQETLVDEYLPVGAISIHVTSATAFQVGDMVEIEHFSSKDWIAALGMDRFPSRDKGSYLDWKPGTLNLVWHRRITAIDGNRLALDAPLTSALDAKLSRVTVRKLVWPDRVRQAGIEHLTLESTYDSANVRDEDHAWDGVAIDAAEDVWVRNVNFRHFAGSAVRVGDTARRVTIADCRSSRPISELGGHRRHTFFTEGQQTLVLRCTADNGRHDFAVGHLATGPNAFVQCQATHAHQYSGPIGSWASGVLYDNVTIDGAGLCLTNRETEHNGAGWAAANCVLWQCTAPIVTCRMPPTAQNWAVGVWGQFVGDGHWRQLNEFVKPDSLFAAQLRERVGTTAEMILKPALIPSQAELPEVTEPKLKPMTPVARRLTLQNGTLMIDGAVVDGGRLGTAWWRGNTLPARATEVGIGITRFVPGKHGPGYTDDLEQLVDEMKAKNIATLEHHWGLWYDRRRDDHQMVRRIDGDVWAPFYELPWKRSGNGTAWDGLSQYDLTQFNPWYFSRLKQFAAVAERNGVVLTQQMYFQHNVLEAGAHWADFPWRPANCLQATGFPEPPPYVGNKRIFMAEPFYDVTDPLRRDLHRRYIRHCLDVLGGSSNVVFQLGEEFSGPLHFVQFWLDTIAEWQRDTGRRALVSLSVPKDVQDAILNDHARANLVSIVDIKYWWPTESGVYAPLSNQNLAPRQQLREWKGKKSVSPSGLASAIRDLRQLYPTKAITVSLDGVKSWAVP